MSHVPANRVRPSRRRWSFSRELLLSIVALSIVLGSNSFGTSAVRDNLSADVGTDVIALPMMLDPPLDQPAPEVLFDRRNITLWLEALRRPEFDLRANAIEAFAQAHHQGVSGLDEVIPTIEDLWKVEKHPIVRFAAARALIEFDVQSAAPMLQASIADISTASPGLVLAVDVALARWNYPQANAMWIARLGQSSLRPAVGISAIQSLAAVGASEAVTPLSDCVRNRAFPMPVRLEAAKAIQRLKVPDRSALAVELSSEPQPWGALLALSVLGEDDRSASPSKLDHTSIDLVESLTLSPDPRVREHALRLLRHADPSRALGKSDLVHDADDQVRLEAVRTLAAVPTNSHVVPALAEALDDKSPPVRAAAKKALQRLGKLEATSAEVRRAIVLALTGGKWRETEQAAILAGELGISSAVGSLATLLEFDRAEVRLAAATSLRLLSQPSSMAALLKRAETLTAVAKESAKEPARFESDAQEITQIFMTFAQQRHEPATDLLRKFIPKRSGFHPMARGAAIYALGKIFESQATPDLVKSLLERAADNNPVDPEAAEVRRMSIVAIGRMGARDAVPTLRDLYESENSTVSVGGASRWAIMKIEGGTLPPCRPTSTRAGPFFIESLQTGTSDSSP